MAGDLEQFVTRAAAQIVDEWGIPERMAREAVERDLIRLYRLGPTSTTWTWPAHDYPEVIDLAGNEIDRTAPCIAD